MAVTPAFFVSADWSTAARKRAVYVADLTRYQIRDATTDAAWTLSALLAYCRGSTSRNQSRKDRGCGSTRSQYPRDTPNAASMPPPMGTVNLTSPGQNEAS